MSAGILAAADVVGGPSGEAGSLRARSSQAAKSC